MTAPGSGPRRPNGHDRHGVSSFSTAEDVNPPQLGQPGYEDYPRRRGDSSPAPAGGLLARLLADFESDLDRTLSGLMKKRSTTCSVVSTPGRSVSDSKPSISTRPWSAPAEILGGDVTGMFLEGAELAVAHAIRHGCVVAVLTDGSPSCGSTYTYDGSLTGGTVTGMGVTARLLADRGIPVFSESQAEEADRVLRASS